jgi:VCBS repeat-containing protein
MQQQHERSGDIEQFLQSLNSEERAEHDKEPPQEEPFPPNTEEELGEEIQETIHVYFVRQPAAPRKDERVIESTPPPTPQKHVSYAAFVALSVNILLFLSVLIVYVIPQLTTRVTITLIPEEKQVLTTATLVVSETPTNGNIKGRLLPSITLTQSNTVAATGHGHQNAEQAQGTITFFNGVFVSQTIAAGTILTGRDGVQVVTDQLASIPAALATTPPTYGQVTVSAHALAPGSSGNIAARDINTACCLPSVLAQNTASFQGGQSERDFTFVTKADIQSISQLLIASVTRSENAALQAQLATDEGLLTPPCTPTTSSNHRPGDETGEFTVTVSEKCIGIAYDEATLHEQGAKLLTKAASKTVGTHYSLFGDIQVTILSATITSKPNGIATILVSISGTWVYQITQKEQQAIKHLIAGKRKSDALHILLSLQGIQRATIAGIDDPRSIPKDTTHIRIVILSQVA